MIPPHVASAVHAANAERREPSHGKQTVSPGDIRHIRSDSVERLVLVLMVNSETNTSQITLVHGYPEFATEYDVVVKPGITGLPYALVIQTDLRGVVSTIELGKSIATVPEKLVDACFQGSDYFIEDEAEFVGPPLLGPLDARWDFKIEEGDTIRELSSAAIYAFDNAEIWWTLEFDEVFSALLLPVDDASEMALAVHELWLKRGDLLVVTPEHIAIFDHCGLLSRELWSKALGASGPLFFDSVMVPIVEKARSALNKAQETPEESIGISELRELQHA